MKPAAPSMTRKRYDLPISLAPFGVNREQAASIIGVSATLFDKAVAAGTMPQPRILGGRLIWDVAELAESFKALPHRDEASGASETQNPWDDA